MDKKRVLIKFAVEKAEYISGIGVVRKSNDFFKVGIGNFETDCFYCDWFDLFGKTAIEYDQKGIKSPARIRMTFIQEVYDLLLDGNVKILRNGNEHLAYELNSAPMIYDSILELQVRRQL